MLTPSRLWKQMTLEQRVRAARAFWQDEQASDDQVQAVRLIAQQKKFRPKSIVSLDDERKARHLGSLTSLPEGVAGRALVLYHLAEQRPMMGAFLDALGIAHQDGLIQDEVVAPDPERVGPAVSQIAERFAPADVSLYLHTLVSQDPQTWSVLEPLLTRYDGRGADA
jgi:hypothetical protein